MQISLKCFATLAKFLPEKSENFEVETGLTVGGLIEQLGIPADDVKIIFINGLQMESVVKLNPGDRVGLFPAVGGG